MWDIHQQYLKKDLERVQQRAARYVSRNYDSMASVTRMQKDLVWETLEQRRVKARVVMGFKIIHHQTYSSSRH